MEIFDITFLGVSPETGRKILFTLAFIGVFLVLRLGLTGLARLLMSGRRNERTRFWIHQSTSLFLGFLLIVGGVSIWFDDPGRFATVLGFLSAGVAFALQKVITSIAAYFVILRGQVFRVGDRILMSGVRGDVIALGFTRTTIMEMGQPPGERPDDPKVWVRSRQFTGRIVTVTNDKIFDNPVFNYSRDFPYIWEELPVSIKYGEKQRRRAEEIILEAARRYAVEVGEIDPESFEKMQREFRVKKEDFAPRVYCRLADSWIELSARFMTREHGSRDIKDKMTREILDRFEAEKIDFAFPTYEFVGNTAVSLIDNRPTDQAPGLN